MKNFTYMAKFYGLCFSLNRDSSQWHARQLKNLKFSEQVMGSVAGWKHDSQSFHSVLIVINSCNIGLHSNLADPLSGYMVRDKVKAYLVAG